MLHLLALVLVGTTGAIIGARLSGVKLGVRLGELIKPANVGLLCSPDSPQNWVGLRLLGLTIDQTFVGFMWRSRKVR